MEKRTELIRKVIAKYTDSDVAISIPSVAVDNTKETTPDREKWLGELYTKVFTRISQKATSTFFLATADFVKPKAEKIPQKNPTSKTREPQPYRFINGNRFSQEPQQKAKSERKSTNSSENTSSYSKSKQERPRIELNERQKVEIRKTINANVIPTLAGAGAIIGLAAGGVGMVVGGAIGAAIGAIAWFWNR